MIQIISILSSAWLVLLVASCNSRSNEQSEEPETAISNQYESTFDLTDTTYYEPVKPFVDSGGLMIGGPNSSDAIRNCKSINSLTIAELEKVMRPGASSNEGFLGANEKLIDVLVADNDFVVKKGLTHADLAIPLLQIYRHADAEAIRTKQFDSIEIEHAGIRWQVEIKRYKGFQNSPFSDNTATNHDITLTNQSSGKTLEFSGLVPTMIERYGFYEGHGTPYRVEPADIIAVLGLNGSDVARD